MVYLFETKDDVDAKPIADFTATIAEEISDEYGNVHFVIEGAACDAGRSAAKSAGRTSALTLSCWPH
ncbi:MAG: hypothetical protein IPM07_30655 [Anaerolineales bacterium]|nr:hypothetical protein [Anaerolineales bacterium]